MPQIVCLGELLIDMVSPVSNASLGEATNFIKAPGGAPGNVAVGLSRLGLSTRFIGKVGNDPFGLWLADVLNAENVDTSQLHITEEARTTIAFVATRADGRKDICFYRNPGADALLTVEEVERIDWHQVRIFHCGSVSLSQSPGREAQIAALSAARQAGVFISYDPNWRPSLWPDTRGAYEVVRSVLPFCDLVKVADEEWEFFTGTTNLSEGARLLQQLGPKYVVVTRGADGAYYNVDGAEGEAAGWPLKAVDTLGAGDAFVAGLLSQIHDWPEMTGDLSQMAEAVEFANACGALATQKAGAIPALPHGTEVDEFLRRATTK